MDSDNYRRDLEDIRDRLGQLDTIESQLDTVESRLDTIEQQQQVFTDALNSHAAKVSELVDAYNKLIETLPAAIERVVVGVANAITKAAEQPAAPPPSDRDFSVGLLKEFFENKKPAKAQSTKPRKPKFTVVPTAPDDDGAGAA
jgi:dsDNA-specific endonuclease/ATPase MutS2